MITIAPQRLIARAPSLRLLWSAMLVLLLSGTAVIAQGDPKRGLYVANAAGCIGCHTAETKDAVSYAGGRALKTPFGTFYGPNITPHPDAGIGRWAEADLVRAVRLGERPDGAHYFPAFPYASFSQMSDADLRDLWAYLRSLPPNAQPSRAHELRFPFGWRFLVLGWKWLFFRPGTFITDAKQTPQLSRGAYLVSVLGHCGECHTPRNFLGGPNRDRLLSGTKAGPEGKPIPNITPTRTKKWNDAEMREFLSTGMTPDFDSANSTMMEVIRNTTSKLTAEDLSSMIAYMRSVPAIPEDK